MEYRHLLGLVVLGALWGASFMFTRVAAPEFGAIMLMAVRVALAAMVLVPLLLRRRQFGQVLQHWRPIAVMGVLHYAIPFSLFAYSLLTLSAGYASVINASAPLMTGLIGWLWLRERLDASRVTGLVVGVAGVVPLAWEKLAVGSGSVTLAVCASLLAAFCYGLAAVFAKKKLAGVDPTAIAGGSMVAATLVLLPLSFVFWPAAMPSVAAWSMAGALGVVCTAGAFVLYFRLIAQIGPSRAITVTFLIPVFAVLFGAVFLGEEISASIIVGGLVVALGTALATGLVNLGTLARRTVAGAARMLSVLIAATVLGATSPDAHAGEWRASMPVHLAVNSFSKKTNDGWDSFVTLAASAELELVKANSPWAINLFSEYHASRSTQVDGTVFAGVQGSHRKGKWDLSGFWFASRYPGSASRETFMTRVRYQFRPGHKFGTEYLAYVDAPRDGELKLGYYGGVGESLSLKLLVGAVTADSWRPLARLELSWRMN
jgi:drug/metabolite transporter (DMT)-like permease